MNIKPPFTLSPEESQLLELENLEKEIKKATVALFKKCIELNDEQGGFHTSCNFSGHVSFITFEAETKNLNLQYRSLSITPYADPHRTDRLIEELNEILFALKMCKAQLIEMHKRWEKEIPQELNDFDYYADPDDLHEYEREVDPWDAQIEENAREVAFNSLSLEGNNHD